MLCQINMSDFARKTKLLQRCSTKFVTNPCKSEFNRRSLKASANCDKLDILYRKEPIANRANSKLRVDQQKYDLRHFQSAIRNIQTKMSVRRYRL